jgi:GT2 family glycosyltransferase
MHVTVCICTRNRGSSIAATLRSLAASTYEDFDVVVVDQSTSEETAEAVRAATGGDGRFRYLRSTTVGLSAARNVAAAQAQGPLIAFTDDDCEVIPEWLTLLVEVFEQHPEVGEVCGSVRAAPYDSTMGYTPVYTVQHPEEIRSPWRMWRAGGIGANMAFRLEALRAAGPFDELLGAGGPLHSCEDADMTYRVLRAGYRVFNTPDAFVIHDGFRSMSDTKVLVRRAYFALGAGYMKHVRLGDLAILPSLLYVWWVQSVSWKKLLLLRRGSGVGYFLALAGGMCASFRYHIDRRQRVFLPRQRLTPASLQAPEAAALLPDER